MIYFFLILFVSFFFFCFCFLEWEPLKSCLYLCLGVLFISFYVSFGLHVWYSYFIVLIFLSGVLSMLTYLCSLVNCEFHMSNYWYFFLLCCCFFFFNFDFYNFFFMDFNFFLLCYDFNYLYVFWLISILMVLLCFISFNLDSHFCMRGLCIKNSFYYIWLRIS